MMLVLICKIAPVSPSMLARLEEIIYSVPVDGRPSERTGEAMTCRIWVKDALMALHDEVVIVLEKSIGKFAQGFVVGRLHC